MVPIHDNPYLHGNYAPVPDEASFTDLRSSGTIPEALDGLYVRIGPNPVETPKGAHHWFTGDGMVHGVRLRRGRAEWYRARWVRTDALAEKLGEPPRRGPCQPLYDSSNTNVVPFAGALLSLTEGCYPYVLSGELETLSRWAPTGELPHGLTAHPKIDPSTGDLHGFAYWWDEPYLLYHRISPDGEVVETVPIELPAPVTMHDFAITEGRVVFFDQPAVFDPSMAESTGFPFRWKPENGARVGILQRGTSQIEWLEMEPCYTFHPVNAFDTPEGLIIDTPRMASAYDTRTLIPPGEEGLRLERWTVDMAAKKIRTEVIDEDRQEFPRIDGRVVGRRHRYAYTIAQGAEMPFDETRLFKHDLVAGTRQQFDFGAGRHPGEFVFVGDATRIDEEDGGWLIGYVHDDRSAASLCIMDAQRVDAGPIATVDLCTRIPYGFHGSWVEATR